MSKMMIMDLSPFLQSIKSERCCLFIGLSRAKSDFMSHLLQAKKGSIQVAIFPSDIEASSYLREISFAVFIGEPCMKVNIL